MRRDWSIGNWVASERPDAEDETAVARWNRVTLASRVIP